jgi:hypothetical protein
MYIFMFCDVGFFLCSGLSCVYLSRLDEQYSCYFFRKSAEQEFMSDEENADIISYCTFEQTVRENAAVAAAASLFVYVCVCVCVCV